MRYGPLSTAIAVGFDTLRVNPLRTILSTLGVIIGVSALVAVLSVGGGMERSVRAQIEETTDLQAILVRPRMIEEVDGQFFPLPNPARLTVDDARQIRALEGAKAVSLAYGTRSHGSGCARRAAFYHRSVCDRRANGSAEAAHRTDVRPRATPPGDVAIKSRPTRLGSNSFHAAS